jgi:thiol-disulfide isomerase/thioredoxin
MDQLVIAMTLYSRPGCHLCDEMKAVIDRVARTVPVALEVVDVSSNPQLDARYGVEIPLLFVEGTKVAKYRVSEAALTRILAARSAGT